MKEGGRRLDKNIVSKKIAYPVFTIVTVVRNCEDTLERTILSIINQNYSNIEYIIIDGDSADNTLNIIKEYEKNIDYWVSEPDNGIYDAMNKGLSLASGDWINFMNSGDEFYDEKVCKVISKELLYHNYDVIYGDFQAKNNDSCTSIIVKAKPLESIWKGMIFSHQSCFCKIDMLKLNPFSAKYKIAADYNQILSLFLLKKSFYYLSIPFSKVSIGGLSYSNINTLLEEIRIVHSRSPFSIKLGNFIFPLLLSIIRKVFGYKLTKIFRKYKWQIYNRY